MKYLEFGSCRIYQIKFVISNVAFLCCYHYCLLAAINQIKKKTEKLSEREDVVLRNNKYKTQGSLLRFSLRPAPPHRRHTGDMLWRYSGEGGATYINSNRIKAGKNLILIRFLRIRKKVELIIKV